eukprot:COSAG05_NODE_38_length_27626_cov_78.614306_3_plen_354_part_00
MVAGATRVVLGAAVLSSLCTAQHVVGPGGVTPYSGGGRSRSGGFGYVREPAEGFFIAGSSITEMNGMYKKVERIRNTLVPHEFHYAYRKWPYGTEDPMTGWVMALVAAPEEGAGYPKNYQVVGGKSSEWILVDPERRDRFGTEGATVIPGAGTNWEHLHRASSPPPRQQLPDNSSQGSVQAEPEGDDLDELPWQVIFIGDADQVEEFRERELKYHDNIARAQSGERLAPAQPCRGPQKAGGGCPTEEAPATDLRTTTIEHPPVPGAAEAFAAGNWEEAAQLYQSERESGCDTCGDELSIRWRQASLHVLEAECHRRRREFPLSLRHTNHALALFPRYDTGACTINRPLITMHD